MSCHECQRARLARVPQRSDLVAVARIKEQSRLGLGNYGCPGMAGN
jgi:hypothetical protein